MKLDQKSLIFVFVVLLILITIYYNLIRTKNNILLLVIVVSIFMYYKKFTNGRIEKFYKEQYKNYKNKNKQIDGFTTDVDQAIQDAFNQVDTNNDGLIDFNEFKLFIQSEPNDLSDDDITAAFNTYDTNNDNHINLKEFNRIMLVGNIASVLDTQNTPTNQYLKKIFLNKSKFHNSSPSINILNRL